MPATIDYDKYSNMNKKTAFKRANKRRKEKAKNQTRLKRKN